MKIKTQILLLLILCHLQFCKAQKSQSKAALPKVENQLIGELDYTKEALELVQTQEDGEEISLGKINTDGTIHFNLPEFDIKTLFDSIPLQPVKFQNWFSIDSGCKDRDVFAETPFDDVYSNKYDPIFIKKYGETIAVLYPVSDEKIVSRNNNQRTILPSEATYFWFYIDRAITFKEGCTKISISTGNTYAEVSADIKFEKGWNFIEENLVEVKNIVQVDSQTTTVRTIEFKRSSPTSKKVKWFIKQFKEDEEIQTLKKLYNLIPISKAQFETWAPNKLGDLSITNKEYGNPPKGRKNKNNMHLSYANETQKREIDLYVVDYSKNPGDVEMIDFAYAMENDGKDEKDIKPYITQFNEEKKITQLLYKVGDRMYIEATGVNINGEELWSYIQKLNLEELLEN